MLPSFLEYRAFLCVDERKGDGTMYKINDDLSIYVTRGDIVLMSVAAEFDGKPYTFKAGDLIRIKVFKKKNCAEVVLEKDFPVTAATQKVQIYLTEEDTKIGKVISKPTDYWYEVELNPLSEPQTIIGYDEDGAKVFKLFPEGADKEVEEYEPGEDEILSRFMDDELDLASAHPVQNQVIARAIARIEAGYEATHAAVAKLHVTPEMFGAIGDGESDDTAAIQKCIDAAAEKGGEVFIPAGTYVISDTIEISNRVNIFGAGKSKTIIKYTGSGYLFDVKTNYAGNAVIANITVEGGNASFVKCSIGKWGAKVAVKSVTVNGFNDEVFRFESCFNPIVEDCLIRTDGKIVFDTYDGMVTETNFTNCAYFCNVYVSAYSGERTPVRFRMTNVRDISFYKCQLEHANLVFDNIEKVVGVYLHNCWFESVDAIYQLGENCSVPYADNCHYVNVSGYKAGESGVDVIDGRKILLQKVNDTSALSAMMNNPVTLDSASIYNPNDGFSEYTTIYRIATDGTDFNQPLNKRSLCVFSAKAATYDLKTITRYSSVGCVFNVLAKITYSDSSYKMVEAKVMYITGVYYVSDIKDFKTMKWEGAVSSSATETLECTDGVLKLESTASMKRCDLMIDFNFNRV
jgi:hypothetical protein